MDQIVTRTLSNGMKLVVWPDRDIPNVAMYTWYRVGSRNERPGITGISHFFEHMMFNGTKTRAPGEFDRVMEGSGGSNNAYTSSDVTVYQNWFPSSATGLIFDLESDRMRNLDFAPEKVTSERGVVYSERRAGVDNDNFGTLIEQMQATAYVAHPYQIPVIGWPSDIEGWTIADLQRSVPAMGDAWTKNGLVYLGGMALDTYHIWSKFPITKIEDLQGKKLAAPGPAANWVRGTGAVPVAGTLNSYYEDIKSGVSDGAVVFVTGAGAAKLHEVAPHITKVNFGAQFAGGVAINKSRFDRLPPEVQKALREAGEVWQAAYAAAQSAAVDATLKRMVDAGAKVGELSDAERKRWADALGPVARTWANDSQSKGLPANEVLNAYMAALAKAGTKLPRDWTK
jgi:hypothetical protein